MKSKRGAHPSRDIRGKEGRQLEDKKIVLCITGSIAAYRAIDLARLLMRHGADVHAAMTEATASTLLNPEIIKWATGNDVVTKLTGNLEHVMLADYDMSDLIIVYPCTANTLGKVAAGIDDTTVTSILSVALGSKIPIIVAPAMHEAMYRNTFFQQNVSKLKAQMIFIEPKMEGGKAKVAEPEQVLNAAFSFFSDYALLAGMRALVTAGSTVEYIDPIRVITNLSSGKMGIAIAQEAKKMGADVTLVYGHGTIIPENFKTVHVSTGEEMRNAVVSELSSETYDIVVMAAAVADFAPARKSDKKIDTKIADRELPLVATKKIIDEVKSKSKSKDTFLVAFKADYSVSDSILIEKAYRKLQECNADIVVANDLGRKDSEVGSDKNEVFIVDKNRNIIHLPSENKVQIARKLMEFVAKFLSTKHDSK